MLCCADTRRQTQSQSKTSGNGSEFENEPQCIKLHSCIPKKSKTHACKSCIEIPTGECESKLWASLQKVTQSTNSMLPYTIDYRFFKKQKFSDSV